MDKFDQARRGNLDRYFQTEALALLERIAVALENHGISLPEPTQTLIPESQEPTFNADAMTCTCGNDPKKACTQCTPARMAWIHNMNPGWRPE